jgi:hypothetical protein
VAELHETAQRYATLEETHIYSPALLGKTHFSFVRSFLTLQFKTLYELGLADYKLPVYSFVGEDFLPGQLSPGTISPWGFGGVGPKVQGTNSFQFKEDLSYSVGRQAIKMGGMFNRLQFNQKSDTGGSNQYNFNSLDDFMAGVVGTFNVKLPGTINQRGLRQNMLGLYVQDDINVRSGLTVNLGLRYEIISVPTEVNGRIANLRDPGPANAARVTPETFDIGDPYFLNPSLLNFAPRIGVAWSPFASGKTAIRAGAGVYHNQITSKNLTSAFFAVPFYMNAQISGNDFLAKTGQRVAFPDAFTTQANLLVPSIAGAPRTEGIEWNTEQPALYKYSFSIQQQVLPTTTLEVGYSGSRATHNFRFGTDFNSTPVRYVPELGGQYIFLEQSRPNATMSDMRWRFADGSSWYNALLLTVSKRFSHGLQFQSSYTFSKSLDDSSKDGAPGDIGGDVEPIYQEHVWGRSAYDVTHSWSTNFTYDLPGSTLSGVAGKVLGGWNIAGILRASSGNPLTPSATRPTVNRLASGALTGNNGTNSCGAAVGCVQSAIQDVPGSSVNLVTGGVKINPGNRDQYFDPASFSWPDTFFNVPALRNYPGAGNNGASGALVRVGNAGRTILTSPGLLNLDLTLRKETAIPMLGEAGKVEFRFEMFNTANHTRLGNPGTSIFNNRGELSGSAGVITGYRGNPRQIQMALKLEF